MSTDLKPRTSGTTKRRSWLSRQWHSAGPLGHVGRTLVWLLVAFNVFAFGWVVVSSMRGHSDIFRAPFGFEWPPAVENFVVAWTDGKFAVAFFNTAVLAVVVTLLVFILAAPAAFMLARQGTRLASGMYYFFVIGIGVPAQVIIIPLFVILEQMGLINSLAGLALALTAVHLPFSILLLTGFFSSLPGELEEAAALDGCGPITSFVRIMLPLARGGIITLCTLNVISIWNDTFLPLVLISSQDKQMLSVALLNFINAQQFSGSDYGAVFAGVAIIMLPMLVVYIWLGRRIIEGMTVGANK